MIKMTNTVVNPSLKKLRNISHIIEKTIYKTYDVEIENETVCIAL